MNTKKIEKIRKRNGSVVEYDERKLERSIYEAARAAGHDDPQLARNLANVVTTYIQKRYDKEVPASVELRSMVEKILTETGYAEIAREYSRYSKKNHHPTAPDLFPQELMIIDGTTKDEVSRWNKDKIISALVKEASMDPQVARQIADSVEQKLLGLKLGRVSTALIRELVNSELISRGHGAHLEKQRIVGMPKYDLRQLLSSEMDPECLTASIGETTLKQFALQEIFTSDVADAHLEGRLHIHHVEHPLKFYWGAMPLSWLGGIAGPGENVARRLDLAFADLRQHFAEAIEVNHANGLPLESIDELCHIVHRNFRRDGARLILGVDIDGPSGAGPRTAMEIVRALERYPRSHIKINVFLSRGAFAVGESADALRALCDVAQRSGGVLFAFERDEPITRKTSRFTRDTESWFAIPQAVSINLPHVYFRANSHDIYSELEAAAHLAVRAHRQKQAVVQPALARLNRVIGGQLLSSRLRYSVGIAGLNELVKLLSDREIDHDEDSVKLAIRIVSYLYYILREAKMKYGVAVELDEIFSNRAVDRFSRVDSKLYPISKRVLADATQTYTAGYHLKPRPRFDRHRLLKTESRFCALLESSAVLVPREQRAMLSADDLLLLVRDAQVDPLVRHVLVL